jgi:hypothetical protein
MWLSFFLYKYSLSVSRFSHHSEFLRKFWNYSQNLIETLFFVTFFFITLILKIDSIYDITPLQVVYIYVFCSNSHIHLMILSSSNGLWHGYHTSNHGDFEMFMCQEKIRKCKYIFFRECRFVGFFSFVIYVNIWFHILLWFRL